MIQDGLQNNELFSRAGILGPLPFYVPLEIFFCPFPEYFSFQDFSLLMPQFLFPLIIAIIIPVYRSKILTTRTKKISTIKIQLHLTRDGWLHVLWHCGKTGSLCQVSALCEYIVQGHTQWAWGSLSRRHILGSHAAPFVCQNWEVSSTGHTLFMLSSRNRRRKILNWMVFW